MNFRKSDIEWCTHTWNPVSGCLHGCDYCYARRIASRFSPKPGERIMSDEDTGVTGIILEPGTTECYTISHAARLADKTGKYARSTPYPKGFSPTFSTHLLKNPEKNQLPARVFVCNMGDLFGDWVPDQWIERVFEACQKADRHLYMFLTKNPARYLELANAGKLPRGNNYWYGTTITNPDMKYFFSEEYNTFLSIEPLLDEFPSVDIEDELMVDWVIIGALTGPGSKRRQPKKEWVTAIVKRCKAEGVPVFLKDNLAPVWGLPLIREYPESMMPWIKEAQNDGNT